MSHIDKTRQIYTEPSGYKSTHYVNNNAGFWTKLNPAAVEPSRESLLDIGYTLSVVERCDGKTEDEIGRANRFTTYISVTAPSYYHWELLPHPDLDRTGYSMLNSPKIIYNGEEIILPLVKNGAEGTDDLQLPFNAGMLVLRETEHTELKMSRIETHAATPSRNVSQNPYAQPLPTFEPVQTQAATRGGRRGRGRGRNTEM